jgi:homoserine dehydrogenase
MDTACACFH